MDRYVIWAGLLGALSAVSLLLGSLIGVSTRLPRAAVGMLAAFGAGALLSALAIELVAPTIAAFAGAATELERAREIGHFLSLVVGCAVGGAVFVFLDQLVNARGGYLRKTAYVMSKVAIERQAFHARALAEIMRVPVFLGLPAEKLSVLLSHLRPRFFTAGEQIFKRGEGAHGLYLVRTGVLRIHHPDHDQPIELGHGEIVGEISLVARRPYSADCEAKTDVELLLLTPEDFESVRKRVPELEQQLRVLVASRLEENKNAAELSTLEKQRWAALAIDAIHQGGQMPTREEMGARHAEHQNAALAIWLGILLDGIPESFIIGSTMIAAVAAMTAAGAEPTFGTVLPYTLIAGLFLSNLPEALSSSQQMKLQGIPIRRILLLWGSLVVLTGLGAALGASVSEHIDHGTLIFVEGVAAGAMLTMICAAMLPEAAHLANPNAVGLSTLSGFLASILFKLLE
ncbi:MAG: cyclic nucleotide-binding domain-containing protein [Nevskiaceae bacterium]